jgi:tRNA nucleotidyltransferase (CCA-adding enzyme)
VTAIVGCHAFHLDDWLDESNPVATRRFLAVHGDELARDLVVHKRADLAAKIVDPRELDAVERLASGLVSEAAQPHRVADLAVDGTDLIAAGFREGPEVGRVLAILLDEVVADPRLNDRATLLARARRVLA